jgi:hypothetical protein
LWACKKIALFSEKKHPRKKAKITTKKKPWKKVAEKKKRNATTRIFWADVFGACVELPASMEVTHLALAKGVLGPVERFLAPFFGGRSGSSKKFFKKQRPQGP